MSAQKGNHVKIEYEGFLDDGRVFDSTEQHGFPFKLTIGAGVYLDALEHALIGKKKKPFDCLLRKPMVNIFPRELRQ